ncbi:MAG: lysophospholipid acyltransferase family protein [Burkholderiaceae bacterium]
MTALFQIAAHLPLWLLRLFGSALGLATWLLSPAYRRMFAQNWTLAMGSNNGSVSVVAKWRAAAQAGQLVTELPKIWCDPASVQRMQIEGLENLHRSVAAGRGVIILTPHLGAFELAPRAIGQHHPITVLYRPSRQPVVERLLQRLRPTPTVATAPANASGVRQLLRTLKKGQAIGMLPDQVPSKGDGQWAPFFGRPAYTMVLPMRLAQATGAALVWALALRTSDGWRLVLETWEPVPETDSAMTLEQMVLQMNRKTEEMILRKPEQYLWAYNRYKTPPQAGSASTQNQAAEGLPS